MITIDWAALAKVVAVLTFASGGFVVFVKATLFFNNISVSLKALTATAVRLEASAERVMGSITDLDGRVGKVELVLDLDDRAQSVVRDRLERRARLRRDRDRVSEEMRDIIHHDEDKHNDR